MYLTNLIFRLSLITLTVTKYVDQNLRIIFKLLIMPLFFFFFNRKKNKEGKKKKLVEVTKIMEEEQSKVIEIKRTKAEIAFQKMQEKMVSNYLIDNLIL